MQKWAGHDHDDLISGQSGVGGLSPGFHQWSPSHALWIGASTKHNNNDNSDDVIWKL